MRILLAAVPFLAGFLLEALSLLLFLDQAIVFATLAHGFAAGFMVAGFYLFFGLVFKKNDWRMALFLLLLLLAIPVLGIAIDLFIVIAIYKLHNQYHHHAEILDDSINLKTIKPISVKYGAGGAVMRFQKKNGSTEERTKALFTLGQGELSSINKLMYESLPDDSDEIRLLAFHILDQQENFITKDINRLLTILAEEDLDREAKAKIEKNLAMLYWELSYRHLVLKDLQESMFKKAEYYAESAIKVFDQDAAMWTLLGRIHNRLKQHKEAEAAFQKALAFNMPASQVLPYLAELKFKEGDYKAIQAYLASDALKDVARIAPVKQFWEAK